LSPGGLRLAELTSGAGCAELLVQVGQAGSDGIRRQVGTSAGVSDGRTGRRHRVSTRRRGRVPAKQGRRERRDERVARAGTDALPPHRRHRRSGTVATASMTLHHGADTFTDIFLLIRVDGSWRIANKAYHRSA
jgi:hypothetical protein